jgi:serine/threonine protein kinase
MSGAGHTHWPTMTDYQEAVQVPRAAFSGPELQHGAPVMNKLGLPRPICGQFASVYELEHQGNRWAVKCFLRNIPDLHSRYAKISDHLTALTLPYFVTFEYQKKGIAVRGNPYPIVKMQWVEGLGLNTFIEKNLSSQGVLTALENDWLQLLDDLQSVKVAHGDLQHGNVLVTSDGKLKLIDYDGMWVPKLKGQKGNEVGHPDYQSPLRTEKDFHADIDGFAGDVIHVAIRALARRPDLWQKYNNGDNLLFRRQDFLEPKKSVLFDELRALGDEQIREKVDDLVRQCGGKVKRGKPSRFFKPKKADPAPQPRPAPAPAQPPPPRPPQQIGSRVPTSRPVSRPAPAPPPKRPPPAPPPQRTAPPPAAAPSPGPGGWLSDHVSRPGGLAGGTQSTARHKQKIKHKAKGKIKKAAPPPPPPPKAAPPLAAPAPSSAKSVRKKMTHPVAPLGHRLLGLSRVLTHFMLLAPVIVVAAGQIREMAGGSGDRATAILATGFGAAAFLGVLSVFTLYIGRRIHRAVGTMYFGMTAVIMLLNIFSELLTAGWSEFTGDDPVQCAVMLLMLLLSGVGLVVEHLCHRLGVVTRWRVPWMT